MPKKYDPEVKARAVRMVREHMGDYGSVTAASVAVGAQLGIARESLRRWVAQADIDDGARPGMTSAESEEIRRLKAENKRLSEANAILRAASIFFASVPIANTRFVFLCRATTEGSRITIPLSLTKTSVFAVPKSIPIS